MAIDIDGPVLGEVFVVSADASGIRIAGPCGPEAWHIEIDAGHDPTDTVASLCRRVLGDPNVVHSTSWRTEKGGVMLTFVAVYDPDQLATRHHGRDLHNMEATDDQILAVAEPVQR